MHSNSNRVCRGRRLALACAALVALSLTTGCQPGLRGARTSFGKEPVRAVWVTRWDDAGAAREFAERYARVAESVAKRAGLVGSPVVQVTGRTATVITPAIADVADLLRTSVEVRAYDTFRGWRADDCFPESPCPYP